jgi:hypothetical protein
MADTNKKNEAQDKEFKVTAKEADRWSVPDDFGVDPRIIAARKKEPKPD